MSLQILGCLVQNCLGLGNSQNSQNSAPVVSNTKDNATIHSGFLVGTGSGTITVSIDSGNPQSVIQNGSNWSYKLPTGSNTWKQGSSHTVSVSNGASNTYTLRKGRNWDVNGDGYVDVIVGAQGVNSNTGAAYIFYSTGANGILSKNDTSANTILTGSIVSGQFGAALLLGDINMDGYSDAIVGAAAANSNTGVIYIFLSQGKNGIASVSSSSAHTTITGASSGDYFGDYLGIGDIDGDGYNDLAICAYGVSSYNGMVYVFKGSGSGIASGSSSSANITFTGTVSGAVFGSFVDIGDTNGDGVEDVLVGSYSSNSGNGAAYLFQSSGGIAISSTTDSAANASFAGTQSGYFGMNGTYGDINGDGYLDIIIGGQKVNSYSGAAYIYLNPGSSGFSGSKNDTSADSTISGNTGDYVGYYVRAGDTNGDGYEDILTDGQNKYYVFQSQGSSGIPSQTYASASTVLTGSNLSYAISLMDVNGDGYDDAMFGASGVNSNTGAAYIFNSSGPSGIQSASISSANTTLTGTGSGGLFGHIVTP